MEGRPVGDDETTIEAFRTLLPPRDLLSILNRHGLVAYIDIIWYGWDCRQMGAVAVLQATHGSERTDAIVTEARRRGPVK
jgi:hypothetical protein